jgi:hypothetical protein
MGEMINAYKILVGKPDEMRPLRRPRCRWELNFKMNLREIGLEGVDWFNLAQDRDRWRALVNTVMNLYFWREKEYLTVGRFPGKARSSF